MRRQTFAAHMRQQMLTCAGRHLHMRRHTFAAFVQRAHFSQGIRADVVSIQFMHRVYACMTARLHRQGRARHRTSAVCKHAGSRHAYCTSECVNDARSVTLAHECNRKYIHTCIHTCINTYTHTYKHALMCSRVVCRATGSRPSACSCRMARASQRATRTMICRCTSLRNRCVRAAWRPLCDTREHLSRLQRRGTRRAWNRGVPCGLPILVKEPVCVHAVCRQRMSHPVENHDHQSCHESSCRESRTKRGLCGFNNEIRDTCSGSGFVIPVCRSYSRRECANARERTQTHAVKCKRTAAHECWYACSPTRSLCAS
jgi:hypothetical protein